MVFEGDAEEARMKDTARSNAKAAIAPQSNTLLKLLRD